jgi:5-methylthioadenosine/S-adenosylhomocysteine deaminase
MNNPKEKQTILINGLILADPDLAEVVPHASTVISGNRLLAVNIRDSSLPLEVEIIDCSGCLIMPGLVNCHTHAAMSLLRGLADDLPLDRWLNDYIFPSEAKHASTDFVYWGSVLSAVEMALGGITTFADGYFHMEHAARAALDVGLRAVIAQGVLDVPTPDAEPPGSWRERALQFLDACPRDSLVRPALFCHSPYLCGPETYVAAAELSAKYHGLLFSHVAETAAEVGEVTRRYGLPPVKHLNGLGVLGPSFVAVHSVHVSEEERELLAQSDTRVVHCPESNMKLASGAAPVIELLRLGVIVGLGTDGPASNNNLDLFEEMRSASLLAKLVNNNPEALSARNVLRMATIDGARTLGMDSDIGSLKAGKLADLIVIDFDQYHLTPVYSPISHLVYSARGSDVRDVMVNGRMVVRGGAVTTVDQERMKAEIADKARDIAQDRGLKHFGSY